MADFDLQTTDIPTGLSVIEASAGTGKTWTISHLLPRLLVDGVVSDIGEVLLVTFTEDAARELGERTRRHLATLVAHADAGTQPGEREEGLRILLDRLAALDAPTREAAVLRLRLALDESDQLAVSTIHSFCKQVLGSEGFLCGMPAGFEVLPDPAELKADAVKDTWRTDLAADPLLAAVAALGSWSVENDLRAWQRLTQRPSTRMDPAPPSLPEARDQVAQAIAAVKAARADLRRLQEIAARNHVTLNDSAANPGRASVEHLGAWHVWFETLDPQQPPVEIFPVVARLAVADTWFRRSGGAGAAASTDAGALRIVAAARAVKTAIDTTGWAWLAHLRQAAGRRYDRSLRRHNAVTYDGLIQRLHDALRDGPNRAALIQRLSEKWTVGLIDESQDTDQQQLDIFRAIFERDTEDTGAGRLILVGDPKQAIYSFRGGDLDAYLSARPHDETRVSDLSTTYRSAQGLVAALNALFGRAYAFGNPALTYPQATAARPDADLPLPDDGQGRMVAWVAPLVDSWQWDRAQPRRERAAACTAAAIVDLLGRPVGSGESRVAPSHVAVLTRTNLEARLVHQALRARRVPAVVRDDGDVMHGEMAADLASILKAVLAPTHLRWRRAAMATRLFGYDSAMLAALTSTEAEQWLTRFSEWGRVWRTRGIAALIAELEAGSGAPLRLAQAPSGERHLTDVRHLMELLQAREAEGLRSPEKLLQWFEGEQQSEDSSSDERLRRLESDDDAVQVVTVHRAKGLEFDYVFCPYLWSVMTDVRVDDRLLVRRGEGWVLADGAQRDNRVDHRTCTAERLREDLRLAYVALTRARRRVTLLAGPLGYTATGHPAPDLRSIGCCATDDQVRQPGRLVCADDRRSKEELPSGCEHGDTLRRLQEAQSRRDHRVCRRPRPSETTWTGGGACDDTPHARARRPRARSRRPGTSPASRGWPMADDEERERRDAVAEAMETESGPPTATGRDLDAEVPLAALRSRHPRRQLPARAAGALGFPGRLHGTLVDRSLAAATDSIRPKMRWGLCGTRSTICKTTRLDSLDASLARRPPPTGACLNGSSCCHSVGPASPARHPVEHLRPSCPERRTNATMLSTLRVCRARPCPAC